jgi:Alkylmercury lyase
MDEFALAIRNATYGLFVDLGRAPNLAETAIATGQTEVEVAASWRSLHEAHALVLQDGVDEIRMANPFSAVPTAYRVRAAGRWWFGNCAWDAFGILAAFDVDGQIETTCPDCGDTLSISVANQVPDDPDLKFHCLVPASEWWDEIGFT